MNWAVDFTPAARRDFDQLDGSIQNRVSRKIDQMAEGGPFLPGAKTLHAPDRLYRVRVGDWRIIYQANFANGSITIARILHRSDAYR